MGIIGERQTVLGQETPFQAELSNSAFARLVAALKVFGSLTSKVTSGFITTLRVDNIQIPAPAANTTSGTTTLVAGTVTVANTAVKTGAVILLFPVGVTNAGALGVGTIVNNTSFVLSSSSGTDARVVRYLILNPQA